MATKKTILKSRASAGRTKKAARELAKVATADIIAEIRARGGGAKNWYDAVRDSKRRRSPVIRLSQEDRILLPFARRRMVATARDQRRNIPDLAWAIRKHLDFVSTFKFHPKTADDGLNRELVEWMKYVSLPENFDVAGRHGRQRFVRTMEACAVVDGDCGSVLLSSGKVQGIEGDRIREPMDGDSAQTGTMVHGVEVTPSGKALSYSVCRRDPNGVGFVLDRVVPAKYMLMHGYYDRFDQVRGITPLATALNPYQDIYESRTYALAKMKVAQLFGLAITRAQSERLGLDLSADASGPGGPGNPAMPQDYIDQISTAYEQNGVPMLDMDPGDDVKFLENRTPSAEFQAFDQRILMSALKALDMPFSFWDEAHTNFFGSRAALQHYLFSTEIKRENIRAWLVRWTFWRLSLDIADGTFRLPRGMEFTDLKSEWIPSGIPWWNPRDEVLANADAIRTGQASTPLVCKSSGNDAYEIMDEEERYRIRKAESRQRIIAAGGRPPEDDPTSISETLNPTLAAEKTAAGKVE